MEVNSEGFDGQPEAWARIGNLSPLLSEGDVKAEEKKVEHAVVFVGPWDTQIIFGCGIMIEGDHDAGLASNEVGPTPLAPEEKGLWIWTGIPGWERDTSLAGDGGEPIYEDRGTWRRPTAEESMKIAIGDFAFLAPEDAS